MNRAHTGLVAVLVAAGLGPAALASPTERSSATAEPAPPEARPPRVEPDPKGRRAVSGCPEGMDCRRVFLEGLREFERETFASGKDGSPWVKGKPGRERVRRADRPMSPTELRPDLPWLADLELPDLPVRWDHRVIAFLEFYKDDPRGRNIMGAWLRAQGKYRDLIVAHLRNAGLPDDLLYVAMIESSYDLEEYSRVGASGLWQFMPAGGRIYGLEINRWLDERNDPERATEAAMFYFQDLYDRFGDWHLAMAAYNAGYGAVLESMAKYNTNDFWQLLDYENGLPWESGVYVPKALACAIVGHNRELFGFGDIEPADKVRWDHVTVKGSVRLSTVARAAGVGTGAVKALNPQLRRGRTPPGVNDYVLRIPEGTARRFWQRYAEVQQEIDQYDTYVVAHGERYEDIATRFGISRHDLALLNEMEHQSELTGGLVMLVPRISAAEQAKNLEKAEDDLYAGGVPEGEPGEPLVVAVPDPKFTVKGKKRVFYRVVVGDTQWGIAKAFGVDRLELARWNGLEPEAHLHARMVLQVFIDPKLDLEGRTIKVLDPRRVELVERGSEAHLDRAEERMGRKRVVYKATGRESFAEIGKKYGLTARDLARINRMEFDTVLEPGAEIIVYEVVDPSRTERAREQARKARRR